jgi:hypothetical protein
MVLSAVATLDYYLPRGLKVHYTGGTVPYARMPIFFFDCFWNLCKIEFTRSAMSYLNPVRLHFMGKFQAAPSTVNNDPVHFDNETFLPSYQERQVSSGPPSAGWWNPQGDATWRLIDCGITTAWIGGDIPAPKDDAIYSCLVADSDRTVAAKLVDLDPEQQLVSEIWGMQVRICRQDGTTLLRSHYKTTAFADIWDRAGSGGGDIGAGAMYQSVLHDLEWGDIGDSAFLQALRRSAHDGLLSIKFNVDGYNMDFGSPNFTRGRIAGTIGPAFLHEPHHFVPGRQGSSSTINM